MEVDMFILFSKVFNFGQSFSWFDFTTMTYFIIHPRISVVADDLHVTDVTNTSSLHWQSKIFGGCLHKHDLLACHIPAVIH